MICIDVSGVPSLANSFARDDLRRRPVFFWRQIKSLPERFIRSYENTCCRYTIHHDTLYDKIMCEDWWDRELHLGTPLCRTPHVTICSTNSTRRVGVYFASIAAFEAFRNFGGQLLIDVRLRLLCSPKHSVAILHLFAISISMYFCNFMWNSVANGVEMAWRNNGQGCIRVAYRQIIGRTSIESCDRSSLCAGNRPIRLILACLGCDTLLFV